MDSSKPKRRVVKMPVEEVKPKKRTVKMPVEEVIEVKPKKRTVKMPVEEVVEVKPKKRTVKMPVEEVKPKKRTVKMPLEEEKQIVFPIYEASSVMVEGDEEPIIVKKVYNVTLEILNHNDKKYYLDASRDKVYERLGDKKHGKYLGRWDSNSEQIISTVDSDCED